MANKNTETRFNNSDSRLNNIDTRINSLDSRLSTMENRSNPDQLSRHIDPQERGALLTEYQACQQDNNSIGSSYWTMAAIFIGVSSAIIIALMAGIISNENLFNLFMKQTVETQNAIEIQTLRTIIVVVVSSIVLILACLRLWLRRVTFLQQINYERMREIESQLGMWKSWRVHGVDHWNPKTQTFDDHITGTDKTRLTNHKEKDWWSKWTLNRMYAPSSRLATDGIFAVLLFMWLYIIFSVFSALPFPLSIIVPIISWVIVIFFIRKTPIGWDTKNHRI